MAWKRFVVVVAAVFCAIFGSAAGHTDDAMVALAAEPVVPLGTVAVLDHLGVCGPIHEAVIRLGPKNEEGKLDTAPLAYEPTTLGTWAISMVPPEGLGISFANHRPDRVMLHEYKGTLQGVLFLWNGTPKEKSRIRKNALKQLKMSKGKTTKLEKGAREWRGKDSRTIVAQLGPRETLVVFISCLATQEKLLAENQDAETSSESAAQAANIEPETPAPDPWLDQSLVRVLLDFGQPTYDPITSGTGLVGLHYEDIPGFGDAPAESWWWFFEGRAVYKADEFLSPLGSSKAESTFEILKDWLRKDHGAPIQEGPDDETGDYRLVYENGPQRLILTFVDPEGDPYFRLEFYDTTQIDQLGPELRPQRSLPKRFTPPPANSGLTREDLAHEAVGS